MYKKQGKQHKLFEGAHIYPLNPSDEEKELLKNEKKLHDDVNHLNNIIALCRDCHTMFDILEQLRDTESCLISKKIY